MTLRDAIKQSGAKAASFITMGDKISGVVIAAELRQARSFETGKLETWDNGDPKENAVVTLRTDLRDADDARDDGTRAVYVKWWGDQRLAFIQTVKQATRSLPEEQQDVMPGGWFSAQWTGELPPTQKGLNGAKTFTYEYRPPAGGIGKAVAGSNVAPPAAQQQTTHPGSAPYREVPVQPQLPIQENVTGPTTPVAPSADPMAVISQIRQLASEGMTPAVISQVVPQYSMAAIQAILGLSSAS